MADSRESPVCIAHSVLPACVGVTILCLFLAGGPIAIVWFVVPVVVLALNRVFSGRWRSHVGHEFSERPIPLFANGYASSAVSCVVRGIGVVAALTHTYPRSISWRMVGIMNIARLPAKCIGCPSRAPATCAFARYERLSDNCSFSTAIANAKPSNFSMRLVRNGDNSPRAKNTTGKIDEVVRRFIVRHIGIMPTT